ncbi:hypothetical protein [Gordonia otitidis]|nr:hypothetical protein [Gordonia otitidis]
MSPRAARQFLDDAALDELACNAQRRPHQSGRKWQHQYVSI